MQVGGIQPSAWHTASDPKDPYTSSSYLEPKAFTAEYAEVLAVIDFPFTEGYGILLSFKKWRRLCRT